MNQVIHVLDDSDDNDDQSDDNRQAIRADTDDGRVADNGSECAICLEPFTKEGTHRIVVTKCGHIFGKSCILKSYSSSRSCPTCRKKLKRGDLIDLYDCNVVAVDNAVVDNLKSEVECEKIKRQKVEADKAKLSIRLREAQVQIMELLRNEKLLRDQINSLYSQRDIRPSAGFRQASVVPVQTVGFEPSGTLDHFCDARVLRTASRSSPNDTLLLSCKYPDNKYHIQRVSLEGMHPYDFVGCSDSMIRDITVSPWDQFQYTAYTGGDHSCHLISNTSGEAVARLDLGAHQAWSCAFSSRSQHELWIGGTNGMVCVFDVRQASIPIRSYSIAFPPDNHNGPFSVSNNVHHSGTPGILPPVQSILHTTHLGHDRVLVGHRSICRVIIPSFSRDNAFVSPLQSAHTGSVYDIQPCPVGAWNSSGDISDDLCGVLLSCRSSESFPAAAHCLSLSSRCPDSVHQSAVVTGHKGTIAASRPAVGVVPTEIVVGLFENDENESYTECGDDVLLVVYPDDASNCCNLSVVSSPRNVHAIGRLAPHVDSIRQSLFTQQGNGRFVIVTTSATQLRSYVLSQ
mmetsp:Transcript_24609/g.36236  ORF Transcript_24609/g.36236 Transcript_24609/m.36236 type:complete len:571 (-) Transcript_24609:126-1838(-)|eukprot:CAMPEP_0185031550 /NCGR_PEP_ID=MMETSP1103-20130426/19086_1 /TAXON_ID=36769 /ORGANISM="Paraphysomonas bandaiensis, Strain Caron Lab Isolate" /LENGTH=570 /DNA_ID=CAMNT_0027567105 /DNA_START=48 /DNA_END=1760 /DNA_ORIENTATION=+